jgi:SPX domain protein involved in polyphosphate accumulation
LWQLFHLDAEISMKFAKVLVQNAIPEWESQYLGYRRLKKKIKEVRELKAASTKTPEGSATLIIQHWMHFFHHSMCNLTESNQSAIEDKEEEFLTAILDEERFVDEFYADRYKIVTERYNQLQDQLRVLVCVLFVVYEGARAAKVL